MPFEMDYYVQSVLVQGTLYVGGGETGSGNNEYIVMAYDISGGKWAKLPPYSECYFAMTVINSQLVLIGGGPYAGRKSKVLGVWSAGSKKWTHPYPDMLTACYRCSAAVYNEWLVVAGGWGAGSVRLSSVQVMNTDTKQWYTAPPTPVPWTEMKTAVVGDVCYFMGGFVSGTATSKVYGVSLPALISQLNSEKKSVQLWKESELRYAYSAPLTINGSLFAVGGHDEASKPVSAIHVYQPDAEKWANVRDLPTPRHLCTCTMISDVKLLVAGGKPAGTRVDIAQLL